MTGKTYKIRPPPHLERSERVVVGGIELEKGGGEPPTHAHEIGSNRRYIFLAYNPERYQVAQEKQNDLSLYLIGRETVKRRFNDARRTSPNNSPLEWYEVALVSALRHYYHKDAKTLDIFLRGLPSVMDILRERIFNGHEVLFDGSEQVNLKEWEVNAGLFFRDSNEFFYRSSETTLHSDGVEKELAKVCPARELGLMLVGLGYFLITDYTKVHLSRRDRVQRSTEI